MRAARSAGFRFYKAAGNTDTHIGNLWTNSGQRCWRRRRSPARSASGWQQVNFATPVTIAAGPTRYVASYFTPIPEATASTPTPSRPRVSTTPPLHALATGVDRRSGMYLYGAPPRFRRRTFNATNYWVDVVFNTGAQ